MISPGAASHFSPDLPATHGGSETQLYLLAREIKRTEEVDELLSGVSRKIAEQEDG